MYKRRMIDILCVARAKLRQGWCKGTAAKDAAGEYVQPKDPQACQWCLLGALSVEADFSPNHRFEYIEVRQQLMRAIQAVPVDMTLGRSRAYVSLVDFNDSQESVEPILQLLDQVISQLTQEDDNDRKRRADPTD